MMYFLMDVLKLLACFAGLCGIVFLIGAYIAYKLGWGFPELDKLKVPVPEKSRMWWKK